VVYYNKYKDQLKQRLWAVFFGVAPDLVGFAPAFFYMLFSGHSFGPKAFDSGVWVFKFASEAYNYTHSLVIFVGVALIVAALRNGRIYWPMFGWLLHILIDIPSHKDFYETPFLFPLSNYRFSHGVSWAHPTYMFINYGALIIVYIAIYLVLRKKKTI
jgi:hypothetical protein